MEHLFTQFRTELDALIEAETISFERMELLENILDQIQAQYGSQVYAGLNRCYEGVLLIRKGNGGEPSGNIRYKAAEGSIEEIRCK